MRKVSDCSERELYTRLIDILSGAEGGQGKGVHQGIGDDAAVLETSPHKRLISSCDIMLEGRHFDLNYTSPRDLGYKALAVNISDIAAMGGSPLWAMVSLALPAETPLLFWEEFYRGMNEIAELAGVTVVGGDTSSFPKVVVDVSILGEARPHQIVSRSAAVAGEWVLVTGMLGSSAAGLSLLQENVSPKEMASGSVEPLIQAHLRPWPRFREAALLRNLPLGAMIDLSDGLAVGVEEICASSGVGARLNYSSLPFLPETMELAHKNGFSWDDWVIYGGEDYELLLTVPAAKVAHVVETLTKDSGTPLTVLGEIVSQEEGLSLVYDNEEQEPLYTNRSYRHF